MLELAVPLRITAYASLVASDAACAALPALAATANIRTLDPDNDSTVSFSEAQAAGAPNSQRSVRTAMGRLTPRR